MPDPLANVFSAETLFTESGIDQLTGAYPELRDARCSFSAASTILEEGQANDRLIILVKGKARLIKRDAAGRELVVDTFGPGALLGLTSFWGRTEVFASVKAETDLSCVSIDRTLFDTLTARHPEFVRAVQNLFVLNLSDRYRNMVRSQVARDQLATELEAERNQLRDALDRLEHATNRMVNQEKLATMGQLLAGIAHEINNPVGALLRGIDSAKGALQAAFIAPDSDGPERILLGEGWDCPYWSPAEKRERMEAVQARSEKIPRSLARRLAQLTDTALSRVAPLIGKPAQQAELERLLAVYELGVCFRAVRLSGGRIEKIITSLRSYGKQDSGEWEESDLVEGIRDTLTVLNHRLKNYDLQLDLQTLPPLRCKLGEINQVWTNLLANAMDATPEGAVIKVATREEAGKLVVEVSDAGPGIDPKKLDTVFEANFTTKNGSADFGLGLGLSISREIVEKHNGTLKAFNNESGGARFEARFEP